MRDPYYCYYCCYYYYYYYYCCYYYYYYYYYIHRSRGPPLARGCPLGPGGGDTESRE